jgi:hypothetical protein
MDTILKQKETLHSIFDYLKENGHESKAIVVHPKTYTKYIRCRTRSEHSPQQYDEIRFSEANSETVRSGDCIGYLDYNDEWQIKVKVSLMVPVDDFWLVKSK